MMAPPPRSQKYAGITKGGTYMSMQDSLDWWAWASTDIVVAVGSIRKYRKWVSFLASLSSPSPAGDKKNKRGSVRMALLSWARLKRKYRATLEDDLADEFLKDTRLSPYH
jgi:hypothetical protein